ncbi:molybdopterin-guanine dinucleotide biosynthesis protein B [Natronobacterium gregoryi]|uniref:Molybdopterin-guanine dinucleotide biosynthesis protein n=2 Tax=Natronobacterium gregoryi TaxID=44930 RepID=L0ALN2_NATGS|nr:molybdopterin-guanine dinucleotide biosynthesis protein B [Natronobacterium gregoryi]AFZ74364.1 molybdopterin-guanine dinucleotide biosynthesis protein [Natronobacterium gregoryi SP2]ELY63330.1 molybdopterin-guanine dinucleotide biosynthesis protein B [Natronobacterium gregoryi SP2]PLK22127.1 molybdopterin-guanine dinucleotide biosynthesis protein B [Natronobacterium gregoryi SP2]SFI54519.1 molybdopterin guanine dinucleotide biosynthesis accessory protein MobB [Natronobacterium gregoryi]
MGRHSSSTSNNPLRVVCLAGPSDSGKTTLVEKLVPRLTEHYRVATVKSIHHDVEIDTPGADTHRHRTAGAETVVGITPELTFDISTRGKQKPPELPRGTDGGLVDSDPDDRELQALESTLARLSRRGYDIVVVEGFTDAPLPTILVGDREPDTVAGEIVGRGDDELEELVETIQTLEEIAFETRPDA